MENRNDERKIICVRHARSEFNSQIDQVMRSLDGLDETETLQAIAKVKFGLEFIDCSLSEEGQRQAQEAAIKLQARKISLVITSPLRRCMQTAQIIFQNHPNKPKILVTPLVKEILSSSCDIPRDINDVKREFPDFDYSLFEEFNIKELWYLEVLTNEHRKKMLLDKLFKKFPTKEEVLQNHQKFVASKLPVFLPQELEAITDLNVRVIKAKKWLREKLNEIQDNGALVVVTHSKFLRSFFSKEYGKEGEFIGSRRLANCEIYDYSFQE